MIRSQGKFKGCIWGSERPNRFLGGVLEGSDQDFEEDGLKFSVFGVLDVFLSGFLVKLVDNL